MIASLDILEIIILLFINALGIFVIIVILANSIEGNPNIWFVVMAVSILGWVNCAYLGFTIPNTSNAIIFYRINDLFVALFLIAAYQFYVEGFLEIRNKITKSIHMLINAIFVPLAIFTSLTTKTVIHEDWGNEPVSGIAFDIFILYAFIFTIALLVLFIKNYFQSTEERKIKVKYFLIGTAVMIILNIIFNILYPLLLDTGKYQHFGDYSAAFFLALASWAMLRHNFLGVKVVLTAFLISVIGILLSIDIIFLSRNPLERALKVVILVFFLGISILVVRSVVSEAKQKDKLKVVNDELKKASDAVYIELKNTRSLYNLATNISKVLDPSVVIQAAVDSLPQDDLMIGAVISIFSGHDNRLIPSAVSRNRISMAAKKLLGDFSQYFGDLNDPKHDGNMTVRAFKEVRPIYSNELSDFAAPAVPNKLIGPLAKILGIKSVVSFPLATRDKPAGVITYFLKKHEYQELEVNQKQLFQTYTTQIAVSLENANLFRYSQIIQANLTKTLNELQEARRKERDMVDIMGHELRTPMSIVRNALSMMDMLIRNQGSIPLEKQKKYVDIGLESARRESKLIETLLSATKADAKGFQLTLERVDLVDVVEDSFIEFKKQAENKGLKVIFEKPSDDLFVYCDRTRVQEIADNFISNAVKYTNEGFVKVVIRTQGDFAWVDIQDSGIGISTDEMPLLGKKFFRAKQHLKDDNGKMKVIRPGGTGLGLYVSFGLAKIMDGDFKVHSELGKGSTFSFSVPLYSNQEITQVDRRVEDYIKE